MRTGHKKQEGSLEKLIIIKRDEKFRSEEPAKETRS